MRIIAIILFSLIIFNACSTIKKEKPEYARLSQMYGINITVNKDKILGYEGENKISGFHYGKTTPAQIKTTLQKAISLHEQHRGELYDVIKVVDVFSAGDLVFEYNYAAKYQDSYIKVCFRNEQFIKIPEIRSVNCGLTTMDNAFAIIRELSEENVASVIKTIGMKKEDGEL